MKKRIYRLLKLIAFTVISTVESVAGILFMSSFKIAYRFKGRVNKSSVIIGNGPSISADLVEISEFIKDKEVFCVNDFCQTEYFTELRPGHYVLLEPIYWSKTLPENIKETRDQTYISIIKNTKWQLNLYLPYEVAKSKILEAYPFSLNENIKIVFFNRTSISLQSLGATYFYKCGLGMPKPYNVLIATIFLTINTGFSHVYLFGADHSWHENMQVGTDNLLYVKQIRFHDTQFNPIYKSVGVDPFKVHEIFRVWSNVFSAYHQLNFYARKLNVKIFNCSSKSFIDAFTRNSLETKRGKL